MKRDKNVIWIKGGVCTGKTLSIRTCIEQLLIYEGYLSFAVVSYFSSIEDIASIFNSSVKIIFVDEYYCPPPIPIDPFAKKVEEPKGDYKKSLDFLDLIFKSNDKIMFVASQCYPHNNKNKYDFDYIELKETRSAVKDLFEKNKMYLQNRFVLK